MTQAPSTPPFAQRVTQWQRTHGRHDLPWQNTRDPYRVWMSEVMLQQTQVATVLAYYDRFLGRFADVQALAQAPLDDVLAAWSGLGYYRRARMAHQCAQAVVQRHGGQFPRTRQGLETLPGIGRSTAAAIAAFCFGEREAILDGNVKRVLTRHSGFDGDLSRGSEVKRLWDVAEALLPESAIEPYTQGLMDLGASLCLARKPRCLVCPVADDCKARQAGDPERYPVVTAKLKRSERTSVWLWLEHQGRLWLMQRPATGVWAGLYSLPEFADFEALRRATLGWPGTGEAMPTVQHALTHFDWTLHPRRWHLPAALDAGSVAMLVQQVAGGANGRWATPTESLELGLPTPWRRMLQLRVAEA